MILDLIDKLVDRVIQLLTYKQQMRRALLDMYITPVFEEFEKVHAAYLDSFSRYRDTIQNSRDPNWIRTLQATLHTDNLFTANTRAKIVRLTEAKDDDLLKPFVNGICEYLMGARLVDPLGKELQPLRIQRWRQGFSRTLGEIADQRWQMVIDPDGEGPPLAPEEIPHKLQQRREIYPVDPTFTTEQDALHRSCALSALDAVVMEMQCQYDQICQHYMTLKNTLSL
jgi:hypothetical protein